MHGVADVLDESLHSRLSLDLGLDEGASHALGYGAHLALLPLLPHPVGRVEEDALEEEDERHPLVVGVVPLVSVVAAEAWMRHVRAHGLEAVGRQGERVRDPAVGVEHVARHRAVRDAVYRVTCAPEKKEEINQPT